MCLLFLVQTHAAAPPRCVKFHKRHLKWNWFKCERQDRLIAKIAQRVIICNVRMHRHGSVAAFQWIFIFNYPHFLAGANVRAATHLNQERLEHTNLKPLLRKNGTKVEGVFLSSFHMQLTCFCGDLRCCAASCRAGCMAWLTSRVTLHN